MRCSERLWLFASLRSPFGLPAAGYLAPLGSAVAEFVS